MANDDEAGDNGHESDSQDMAVHDESAPLLGGQSEAPLYRTISVSLQPYPPKETNYS